MSKCTDLQFDRDHLWHPYTSIRTPLPCYPVRAASGVYIELETGEKLVDGMSSWWSTIHGYSHPALVNAAITQLKTMSHVMFGGLTHAPATNLGKRLLAITHPRLNKLFLADSGSVSVEVALKMALQYQQGRGRRHKTDLMTVQGGYHGDTFAAMSVGDPINGMHSQFANILPKAHFLPRPTTPLGGKLTAEDHAAIEQAMAEFGATTAAFIIEPLVQGAGGMHFYGPEYLTALRRACDKHDIVLIFDEIATGFGRTGKLFAYEHTDICPDILCLGKALTGGTMTLAATLSTDEIADGICASEAGVFMHGPTFMANPLACAVAQASLSLLADNQWQTQVKAIEQQLRQELTACQNLLDVQEVRVFGAIGVVEMKHLINVGKIQQQFIADGVWIRPFGRLIYIMPPYLIKPEELTRLTAAIYRAIINGEY